MHELYNTCMIKMNRKLTFSLSMFFSIVACAGCADNREQLYDLAPGSNVEMLRKKTSENNATVIRIKNEHPGYEAHIWPKTGKAVISVQDDLRAYGIHIGNYPTQVHCGTASIQYQGKLYFPTKMTTEEKNAPYSIRCDGESVKTIGDYSVSATVPPAVNIVFDLPASMEGAVYVTMPFVGDKLPQRDFEEASNARTFEYVIKKFDQGGGWH